MVYKLAALGEVAKFGKYKFAVEYDMKNNFVRIRQESEFSMLPYYFVKLWDKDSEFD